MSAEIAKWIVGAGGIGLVALILGSLFKAWGRVDSRTDALMTALTMRLDRAEKRVDALEAQSVADETRRKTNLSVISLLLQAVQRLDPIAPELARARAMLSAAYGIDPETPHDMMDMLHELDRVPAPRRKRG